jgi:hypothetical protein
VKPQSNRHLRAGGDHSTAEALKGLGAHFAAMRRVAIVLAIGAIVPLAGCQSLIEKAQERCRAQYPAGSAAYDACWHRDYDQQMKIMNDDLDRRARFERHKGY